jgi:hypothetical protein
MAAVFIIIIFAINESISVCINFHGVSFRGIFKGNAIKVFRSMRGLTVDT